MESKGIQFSSPDSNFVRFRSINGEWAWKSPLSGWFKRLFRDLGPFSPFSVSYRSVISVNFSLSNPFFGADWPFDWRADAISTRSWLPSGWNELFLISSFVRLSSELFSGDLILLDRLFPFVPFDKVRLSDRDVLLILLYWPMRESVCVCILTVFSRRFVLTAALPQIYFRS